MENWNGGAMASFATGFVRSGLQPGRWLIPVAIAPGSHQVGITGLPVSTEIG